MKGEQNVKDEEFASLILMRGGDESKAEKTVSMKR